MRKLLIVALSVCATAAFASEYSWDDGTADNAIGLNSGGTFSWGNQFTSIAGSENLTEVLISWDSGGGGNMVADGTAVTVNIWSDPNNDGNPDDAVLISTLNSTVSNSDMPGFVTYDVPDVMVAAGQNFFAGAIITHAGGIFPASIDQTAPNNGHSWITTTANFGEAANTFNLTDLAGNGLDGDWMIRVTGAAPVPEPASMAVLGLGALALIRKRRRK